MTKEFNTRKEIKITCESPEETFRIAENIHNQLKGLYDYIHDEIVLHYSDEEDIAKGEPNTVWLYISNEVKAMPDITLPLKLTATEE